MRKLIYLLVLVYFAWIFRDRPPLQLTNLMLMLIFWVLVTRE